MSHTTCSDHARSCRLDVEPGKNRSLTSGLMLSLMPPLVKYLDTLLGLTVSVVAAVGKGSMAVRTASATTDDLPTTGTAKRDRQTPTPRSVGQCRTPGAAGRRDRSDRRRSGTTVFPATVRL